MKQILLSFADKRYTTSFKRLYEQLSHFPFDEIHLLNEDDLPDDYLRFLRPRHYRRGFGYWRWKSYIVKRQLDLMDDGDILFYSDGGTFWNSDGISRYNEYIEMLKDKNGGGILTFQEPFLEKDYTKGDLLQALNVYEDEHITVSFQLWAGCFALRKCSNSISFVNEWFHLLHNPEMFHLITDKKSNCTNLEGFVDHRHDQSAFSIIVKKYPHMEISWKEQRFLQNPNKDIWRLKMKKYPIQSRRLIGIEYKKSLSKVIQRKIELLPSFLICIYLRIFEGFTFKNKWARY